MVSIAGLDKAEVLAALHAASHAQGMGILHDKGALSVDECRKVIDSFKPGERMYFDYLRGRVLKVDLTGNEFDARLFDRDNYPGAAENAIDALMDRLTAPAT